MSAPKLWSGYVAASADSEAEPFPAMLVENAPAWCISLDDLPTSTGAAPATPTATGTHEWNVGRWRKWKVCFDDGTEGTAYFFSTAPVSGGV